MFLTALRTTLATDLSIGVVAGVAMKVVVHLVHGVKVLDLLRTRVRVENEDNMPVLVVYGAAVFTTYLGLKSYIDKSAVDETRTAIDYRETRRIDHSAIEKRDDMAEDVRGLDEHQTSSGSALGTSGQRGMRLGLTNAQAV